MRYFPLADADAAKRAWHLALQHVSVARRVSWRLVRRTPALRPYLEDLIQEATVGMYRAALTYAPERCAFETWAWWWASCFARRAARAALNPMSGRPRGEPLSRLALDPLESHREPTSTSLNAELVAEAHLLAARLQHFLEKRRARPAAPGLCAATQPGRDVHIFLRRLVSEDSLAAIGAELGGLTRERVRQLEAAVARDFDAFTAEIRRVA